MVEDFSVAEIEVEDRIGFGGRHKVENLRGKVNLKDAHWSPFADILALYLGTGMCRDVRGRCRDVKGRVQTRYFRAPVRRRRRARQFFGAGALMKNGKKRKRKEEKEEGKRRGRKKRRKRRRRKKESNYQT